jgi:hypothetical protein
MGRCNQSGTKFQRQNQQQRLLMMKIARHTKRGWNVAGLEKELAFSLGDKKRPAFRTGRDADKRFQRWDTND